MTRNIFWAIALLAIFSLPVYGADTTELIEQVSNIYAGGDIPAGGLAGGFSLWSLIGGIVFGSIGFAALVYGKRNAQFRPIFIGIALMACPYFLRGTVALYITGIALTAALYFFRE